MHISVQLYMVSKNIAMITMKKLKLSRASMERLVPASSVMNLRRYTTIVGQDFPSWPVLPSGSILSIMSLLDGHSVHNFTLRLDSSPRLRVLSRQ